LELDLVFNPEADFLPPNQSKLEEIYHKKLKEDFNLKFTHLITITNMPIGRFRESLLKKNKLDEYMRLLQKSFNPDTLNSLMCRNQISVNWYGDIYDCDFNLAENLPLKIPITNINDPAFKPKNLLHREIALDEHCFGCTAGQGSSCGGALVS
jgi:radical SAM/Cys-rich protein